VIASTAMIALYRLGYSYGYPDVSFDVAHKALTGIARSVSCDLFR
jgi:hypothetical protein